MSLARMHAVVRIDGRTLTGAEAAVSEAMVEIGLGARFDRATLSLAGASPAVDLAPGTALEVSLGRRGDETAVFTGVVTDVRRRPDGTFVEALTDAVALSDLRVGRAYVDETVAGIVADLVESAGVAVGDVDAPLRLPVHHVSEHRSAWRHVVDLATLLSAELRSSADGAVNLTPAALGPPRYALRRGAELTDWHLGGVLARTVPSIVPAGAASEAGADRWNLPLAEPDGGAPDEPTIVPATVRTRDAARAVHEGLSSAAARRTRRGWATTSGHPEIRSGDMVDLVDVPGAAGTWRVLEAAHRLGADGLTTRLQLEGSR